MPFKKIKYKQLYLSAWQSFLIDATPCIQSNAVPPTIQTNTALSALYTHTHARQSTQQYWHTTMPQMCDDLAGRPISVYIYIYRCKIPIRESHIVWGVDNAALFNHVPPGRCTGCSDKHQLFMAVERWNRHVETICIANLAQLTTILSSIHISQIYMNCTNPRKPAIYACNIYQNSGSKHFITQFYFKLSLYHLQYCPTKILNLILLLAMMTRIFRIKQSFVYFFYL